MQRYFSNELNNKYFTLQNEDIHHIKNVMRMNERDKIEIVYKNNLYIACIEDINKNIKIKYLEQIPTTDSKIPKITIIIPYLKEQKLDIIFQKSTELGINKFIVIPMEHAQVKITSEIFNKKKFRWERICKEASEQSKRLDIPNIEYYESFKLLSNLNGLNLVCSTKNDIQTIKKVLLNNKDYDTINIVIGPEGGISNNEEQYLNSIGYRSISLGQQILRVETAPICVLSQISYEYME